MKYYCSHEHQVYPGFFVFDAYGDKITTVTGSHPAGYSAADTGITDIYGECPAIDDGQCPVIMITELTDDDDVPGREVLAVDPRVAIRLAMRLMAHATMLVGADEVRSDEQTSSR